MLHSSLAMFCPLDQSLKMPLFAMLSTMRVIVEFSPGHLRTTLLLSPTTQTMEPQGAKKIVPSECHAMIGQVARAARTEKPLLKAGNAYHKFRVKMNSWPKVRGVAMNPVEHLHGSGNHQHIGHAITL
ncbi:60S ribosomal protein L8-1 [Abeliophyllum distichum]|uniref:60S ribosomal protein L8-1 n=1 Tax=Abeliophyllum distichum TaxID=126358 RepID=A0ABD1QK08_9LAMI